MKNIGSELAEPALQAQALATLWQATAFPALRQAAADIRDYGMQMAGASPTATTPDQLTALFLSLTAAAQRASNRAQALYGYVEQIERGCAALRSSVKALHQLYLVRAANSTAETKLLRDELAALVAKLPGKQEKYHHYVTVAATTVTYAWIPLFGWLAGGAVAGTYGRAAVLEKEEIDKDVGRIATITANLTTQEHQLAILMRATQGLDSMLGSFGRVLPVLQHTQGIWGALHDDLAALIKQREAMADAAAFAALLELELQTAVDGWREVARIASDYLQHAEVLAAPEPAPFGNFRTKMRYSNQLHDENHVLSIDLLGVAVNGVPVNAPVFAGRRLSWGWQTDAKRQDKPETADILFTADAFEGQCNFPMEGRIDWLGQRI
ncbi:hypothetical protein [Variovorax fucosicus]|uniref:hypothetical protein n=1 Tax=Variovorax fucosicus TaxID=3053517 RepID=UPI0025766015|nr:hypothetical protein [Variovorax sp. J22G47]MDM0058985.1 hypothetical protein [Variovorax sp. J22G47]